MNGAVTALCFLVYRQLQISLRRPTASTFRLLGGYSFYVLIINLSAQIAYYSDSLVVGAFLSTAAVAFYAVAGALFQYTKQIVSALGITLFPMASSLDAKGRREELSRLLINGTRAVLLIILPVQTVLFFRGHTFIGLWISHEYGQISGGVLQVLLIAQIMMLANYAAYNVAGGLGRHKPVALIMTAESIGNIVLSIVLVRRMGLNGVAWGTVIPAVGLNLIFWPLYIRKITDVSIWRYVREGWARPVLAVVPFGMSCFIADRLWMPDRLSYFFLQSVALIPILVVGIAVCFWNDIGAYLACQPDRGVSGLDTHHSASSRPTGEIIDVVRIGRELK